MVREYSQRPWPEKEPGRIRLSGKLPQDDHVDVLAFADDGVAGDDGQTVGQDHRAQDRRALLAGETRAVAASSVRRQRDAQVSAAVTGIRNGSEGAGAEARAVDLTMTGH